MPTLYVVCPNGTTHPHIASWIAEAWALGIVNPAADGWDHVVIPADKANAIDYRHAYSLIAESRGPVLIICARSLGAASLAALQVKIGLRCIITLRADVTDSVEIFDGIAESIQAHHEGKPRIPFLLATAIQIIAKLAIRDCWGGGALNKAFLWSDDLRKGGFTASLQTHVDSVRDVLLNKGFLKKKDKNGGFKVALNSDNMQAVDEIMNLECREPGLQKYLFGCDSNVPYREVEELISRYWDKRNEHGR